MTPRADLPNITGYKTLSNGYTGDSAGTGFYIKVGSKVERFENPHHTQQKMRSRILIAKIDNVWYGEFYAPVSSETTAERQNFYAYAAEAITKMLRTDASIPMVLMGDFNGHI